MPRILPLLFAAFFFSLIVSGQVPQEVKCPQITINDSVGNGVSDNPDIRFAAQITGELREAQLKYTWSVSGGTIIEGQGTPNITVNFSIPGNFTAVVEVEGFPSDCHNTASDTIGFNLHGDPAVLDELTTSAPKIYKGTIDNLVKVLKETPGAVLYFVVYRKKNFSKLKTSQKIRQIKIALVKKGIPVEKLIFISGGVDQDLIKIFLVPADTTQPS